MSVVSASHLSALRCEYKVDPLGIDVTQPRLFWRMESDARGAKQTGYQVLVASSLTLLDADTGDLWDTGRVESDASVQVVYQGLPLSSRQKVYWKVRAWDREGSATDWSQTAAWEMALLGEDDWRAEWITSRPMPGPAISEESEPSYGAYPGVYFRTAFAVHRPFRTARLYITTHGVFEARVNGARIGDHILDPGWTEYRKRLAYQTFDVTDAVMNGDNAIGVIVGEGWYAGQIGWEAKGNHYGEGFDLLAQLEVVYEDGSVESVVSDESWVCSLGPITYSGLLAGEGYDARKELAGWSETDCDTSGWSPVAPVGIAPDDVPLVARVDPPIRIVTELTPKSIARSGDSYIVDMEQNMVGWARLVAQGPAGTTIKLRFAEILNADGSLYVENLRSSRQTDRFTLAGRGVETFEPHFTFHGFRFIEVTGYPGDLSPDAITGCVVHSDTPFTGRFETGNPDIDQLWRNVTWGQRSNFISVPTDCPQRDERLGWMGDAQIFIRSAAYNADVASFFTKWIDDVIDAQAATGSFADVCPRIVIESTGAPAWADAGIIIPMVLHELYGDERLLAHAYPAMKAWIDYLDRENPDHRWINQRGNDYGDWLSIDADTSKDVLATAYFAYSADLVSQAADTLGYDDDAVHYGELSDAIKAAFRQSYISDVGIIEGDTQTAYVLALRFQLATDFDDQFAERLVADIRKRGNKLSTGFLGVGHLLHALTETGNASVAYDLLLQDEFPSWLYSIRHGATTIWERWDGWTDHAGFQDPGMNSFNHYALGSVAEWLYASVAGIRTSNDAVGYKRFTLAPQLDARFDHASATVDTLYGAIESNWRTADGNLTWTIVVPANTHANVTIPTTNQASVRVDGLAPRDIPGVHPRGASAGASSYGFEAGRYEVTAAL